MGNRIPDHGGLLLLPNGRFGTQVLGTPRATMSERLVNAALQIACLVAVAAILGFVAS